jgi:hypothetical protein
MLQSQPTCKSQSSYCATIEVYLQTLNVLTMTNKKNPNKKSHNRRIHHTSYSRHNGFALHKLDNLLLH